MRKQYRSPQQSRCWHIRLRIRQHFRRLCPPIIVLPSPYLAERQPVLATVTHSIKLVRNLLVVCHVNGGTVCSWVARRREVTHRRNVLGPTATTRLPQVGPDQRLCAMLKCLFDRHDRYRRWLLPLTAKRRLRSASRLIRARQFTRYVSFTPGTKKISPMRGSSIRFLRPSIRLLPRRSGMNSVRPSSATCTKPGRSPLGEQYRMAHYNDEVKLLRSDWQRQLPSRYSLAKFNSRPAFVSLLEPSGLRQPIKLILVLAPLESRRGPPARPLL